jgi:cytochrome P450
MKTELGFDPFDASQTQHMWDLMRELRRRAPVAHIGEGFVYVSRYEDAREVLRDQQTFSNAGGMRPTGTEIPLHDASIGETVPPVHPPIRRLALAAATGGGVVERMRPHARAVSDELLEGIASLGAGDLIEGLSLALTNRVIGGLLGVPAEECDRLAAWSEEIMHSTLTVTNRTERGIGYEGAFPEFTAYLDSLIEKGLVGMSDAERAPEEETDTLTRIVRTGLETAELDTRIIRMILMNLVLDSRRSHPRPHRGPGIAPSRAAGPLRDPHLHFALRARRRADRSGGEGDRRDRLRKSRRADLRGSRHLQPRPSRSGHAPLLRLRAAFLRGLLPGADGG